MKQGNPTNVEFKPKCAYMEKNFTVVYTTYMCYRIKLCHHYSTKSLYTYLYSNKEMWMKIYIQGLQAIKIG